MMTPSKPLQIAVALAYRSGDAAPKIVAKGRGLVAEEIMARAKEHGVFMHESKELVSLLMQVDLDREIPPALYRAVAELLAWLRQIESNLPAAGKKEWDSECRSCILETLYFQLLA